MGLQAYEEMELLRLVYFGGVDASLRKEVWPFLLGHYHFGMSEVERKEVCQLQDYVFFLKASSNRTAGHLSLRLTPRWTSRSECATSRPCASGLAVRRSSASGRKSSMQLHWRSAFLERAWTVLIRSWITMTPPSAVRWCRKHFYSELHTVDQEVFVYIALVRTTFLMLVDSDLNQNLCRKVTVYETNLAHQVF